MNSSGGQVQLKTKTRYSATHAHECHRANKSHCGRRSKLTSALNETIRLIPDKSAQSVNTALLALQKETQFESLTSDNGREFARLHEAVTCPVYYCHAYASFERGSNENHNRMIRRFLSKGTKQTTVQAVSKIET
ncbi:IS30 family transposase [Lactovum miscens]|uniref:IS30 family transposase n=1 Tax=Lactovum miscens TaxID=190387 RepID=A0A841C8Z2_9LACT|nr:IS30 family transposase [Lactovum miscens]MBB5888188.1 IS30 family transposase [Lactovum miscens]